METSYGGEVEEMKSITCDGCGLTQTSIENIPDGQEIFPSRIERRYKLGESFYADSLMDLCNDCHKDLKSWLVRRIAQCKEESKNHGI